MYLGAFCICFWLVMYLFSLLMYLFSYGFYMSGGDIMFFISVSCFTCATLVINLYYEVIHDICLLFYVFVKSRSYFVLLLFSTHAFMCLLSVSGIYRLIQSCCCLQ